MGFVIGRQLSGGRVKEVRKWATISSSGEESVSQFRYRPLRQLCKMSKSGSRDTRQKETGMNIS
jgi:hypothetical protein